jgi:hypothetical protein
MNYDEGESRTGRFRRNCPDRPHAPELLHFYEVVTRNTQPKTSAEDFLHDLDLFKMIINALRE